MNESDDPDRKSQRHAMVAEQIARRGVRSARVLAALERVPRHRFVSEDLLAHAYEDRALKIGGGQTISQPYMVAVMTECLEIGGCERVLEIGTGSGYQAAVLALLAREVFTIERNESLACSARERLSSLGYNNIRVIWGDGTIGDSEHAPFDALLVAAAAPAIPPPLLGQLAEGGRLVIPVGDAEQQTLTRIRKTGGRAIEERLFACQFVPLRGRYGRPEATV